MLKIVAGKLYWKMLISKFYPPGRADYPSVDPLRLGDRIECDYDLW